MKQTSNVRQTLAIFWQFTSRYKGYFYSGTGAAMVATIIQDIIPPFIISLAFTRLQVMIDSGQPLQLNLFLPYLYIYIGFMIAGVALWRLQVWLVWQYEIRTIRDLSIHIFNHLQHMDTAFHSNRFGGALVSQTNKFLSAYEKVMDEFTWSITTGVVALLSSFAVLLYVYAPFAYVLAITSAIFFVIIFHRTKITMPFDRKLASSESLRTAKIADMITNISAVTTYAGEAHEKRLFSKQAESTHDHYLTVLRKYMVNDIFNHGMNNVIAVAAFATGILAITVWHQPAGVLFLAVNYTLQINRRLWESGRVLRNLNRAFGDATDMTTILQIQPGVTDLHNARDITTTAGAINFKDIVFGYEGKNHKQLFDGLSLDIKPGEKVGLVGHSGGGKTTITKLLLRLVDVQGGTISIDDQDITLATQTSVRRTVAYVPQEPLLFHRTLGENIAYGRTNASPSEIEAVAKLAHAHEFIVSLPRGYETLVGERGIKLSGGQRQRVAIARAMLKNAPILLLDEATSALDSESELLIQDALWKLMEGRTAIVIAHRLSTIQKMDRIIVMDNGQIIEQGSHKDLLKQKGTYAKLWAHQSGGFIED